MASKFNSKPKPRHVPPKRMHSVDRIILNSRLAEQKKPLKQPIISANLTDEALIEELYEAPMEEVILTCNDVAGNKEFDTIPQWIEEKPVSEEPQRVRTSFADVVLKIRNEAFLKRLREIKLISADETLL